MKQNSLLDKIRRVLSILLNLAVVRMEPIAIRMSWEAVGEQTLTFYTENSNLFSAAVCLLVAVCQLWALLSGRALPRWVKRLKFIAACCLTLTFLTVVFVLAPCYPDEGGVVFLLTESSMLYHHLLNPVLVFVSFVFLEREPRLPARNIPLALVPTAIFWMSMLPGMSSSLLRPMPMRPEHRPMMKVSALNTSEMFRLDAPMARRMPISLRRSSTLI